MPDKISKNLKKKINLKTMAFNIKKKEKKL